MSNKETLKAMLQDIINDRQEQAAVTMHEYFVAKTREVTGLVEDGENMLKSSLQTKIDQALSKKEELQQRIDVERKNQYHSQRSRSGDQYDSRADDDLKVLEKEMEVLMSGIAKLENAMDRSS